MLSYGDHLKDIVKGSLPLNHNTGIDMLNYIKIKWGGIGLTFTTAALLLKILIRMKRPVTGFPAGMLCRSF